MAHSPRPPPWPRNSYTCGDIQSESDSNIHIDEILIRRVLRTHLHVLLVLVNKSKYTCTLHANPLIFVSDPIGLKHYHQLLPLGASSISCGGARPTTGRGRAQLAERLSLEHPLRLPERSTGDAPPLAHAADVGARDGRRVLPTRGLQRGGFR